MSENEEEPAIFSANRRTLDVKKEPLPTSTKSDADSKIVPLDVSSWNELGVCDWLRNVCSEMKMSLPTPIQSRCIPQILKGFDVYGCAPTGSGKTGCFAIPILQTWSEDPYGIYALILTPTRELAFQIAEQFRALGSPCHLRVEVIIGGRDMIQQSISLSSKPHIIIATPGRLLDHLQSNKQIKLDRIKYLVLDEADRLLLNHTLSDKLSEILPYLSPVNRRQTLLFSATLPTQLKEQTKDYVNNTKSPYVYNYTEQYSVVSTLSQFYIFIPSIVKDCYLTYLLRLEEEEKEKKEGEEDIDDKPVNTISTVIVFASTCRSVAFLHSMLLYLGISNVCLHGQMSQHDRLHALNTFRQGKIRVLIATDVASRGLDIPTVQLVINYDLPQKIEDYIHRAGRTARAGRGGRCYSFITQYDIEHIQKIEKGIGKQLSDLALNEDIVMRHANETTEAQARARLFLEESGFGEKEEKRKRKDNLPVTEKKKKKQKLKASKE